VELRGVGEAWFRRRENDAGDMPSVRDKVTKNNATNVVLVSIYSVTQISPFDCCPALGGGL